MTVISFSFSRKYERTKITLEMFYYNSTLSIEKEDVSIRPLLKGCSVRVDDVGNGLTRELAKNRGDIARIMLQLLPNGAFDHLRKSTRDRTDDFVQL